MSECIITIQPSDFSTASEKIYEQWPDACWECYACVRLSPPEVVFEKGISDWVKNRSEAQP
jgi:NAD-dependent dihydropyrimidine dehydrogenase PreA subunit